MSEINFTVCVLGKEVKIQMRDDETYGQLRDRAIAAAGYTHQDYSEWEMTTRNGVVVRNWPGKVFSLTGEGYLHLNPTAGITA